jgi:hypothetical protein
MNDWAWPTARSVGVPMLVAIVGLLIEPSGLAVPVSSSSTLPTLPRPNATLVGSVTHAFGSKLACACPRNSDA